MTAKSISELSIEMIGHGVIFRGGIAYGDIYHDNEIIFGPAMNKAYKLESKKALYPGIIIDQPALELKNDEGKSIPDYPGQFILKGTSKNLLRSFSLREGKG